MFWNYCWRTCVSVNRGCCSARTPCNPHAHHTSSPFEPALPWYALAAHAFFDTSYLDLAAAWMAQHRDPAFGSYGTHELPYLNHMAQEQLSFLILASFLDSLLWLCIYQSWELLLLDLLGPKSVWCHGKYDWHFHFCNCLGCKCIRRVSDQPNFQSQVTDTSWTSSWRVWCHWSGWICSRERLLSWLHLVCGRRLEHVVCQTQLDDGSRVLLRHIEHLFLVGYRPHESQLWLRRRYQLLLSEIWMCHRTMGRRI